MTDPNSDLTRSCESLEGTYSLLINNPVGTAICLPSAGTATPTEAAILISGENRSLASLSVTMLHCYIGIFRHPNTPDLLAEVPAKMLSTATRSLVVCQHFRTFHASALRRSDHGHYHVCNSPVSINHIHSAYYTAFAVRFPRPKESSLWLQGVHIFGCWILNPYSCIRLSTVCPIYSYSISRSTLPLLQAKGGWWCLSFPR